MKKKKGIVVEVIEQKLLPYGFVYSGYESLRWTFSREVNGKKQYVVIQKSNWGDEYCLEINEKRIREITENSYLRDFRGYKDAEEQQKVLEDLCEIVIYYGLEKLQNDNKPEALAKPSKEMHQKLYEQNAILTRQFMERYHYTSLDNEGILLSMQSEMNATLDRDFEEIQDKLVELAAVYGNLIIQSMGGEWTYDVTDNTTDVRNTLAGICTFFVLRDIVRWWNTKEKECIIREFITALIRFYDELDRDYQLWKEKILPRGHFKSPAQVENMLERRAWAVRFSMGRMDIHKDETIRNILCSHLGLDKEYRYTEHGRSWAFVKQIDNGKEKSILINDTSYAFLSFRFFVDGAEQVDGSQYMDRSRVKVNSEGHCPYKNEEEFANIIGAMGQVIVEQGDKIFDKILNNKIDDTTMSEMQKEIYERNRELMEKGKAFLEIEELTGLETIERISRRLDYLNKTFCFLEAKQELLALGAVYGELFRQIIHGNWFYNENSKTCVVTGEGIGTFPLNDVLAAWRTENYQILVNRYLYAERTFGKG